MLTMVCLRWSLARRAVVALLTAGMAFARDRRVGHGQQQLIEEFGATANVAELKPPFQWVNPTRTGSSFDDALIQLTCPDNDKSAGTHSEECETWQTTKGAHFGQHDVWTSQTPSRSAFVTLRAPFRRMQSELHNKYPRNHQRTSWTTQHGCEGCYTTKEWQAEGFCELPSFVAADQIMLSSAKHQLVPSPAVSHNESTIYSYQLQIGNGNDDKGVERACRRLKNVAWVGLTDQYRASVCLLQAMYPHNLPPDFANNTEEVDESTAQTDCPQQWLEAGLFLPQDELRWTSMVYVCGVARFARDMLQYGGACAGEMVGAGELEPGPAGELMEAVRGGQRAEAWKMLYALEASRFDLSMKDILHSKLPTPHRVATATKRPAPSAPYHWIHPTKTGSSFGNTLLAMTCPEMRQSDGSFPSAVPFPPMENLSLPCQFAWGRQTLDDPLLHRANKFSPAFGRHYPWTDRVKAESTFVTLRAPLRRLESEAGYRDVLPKGFCDLGGKQAARQVMQEWMLRQHFRGLNDRGAAVFSYAYHVGGSNDDKGVERACRRLKNVAWVGLTDQYKASVCLLQAMYPHAAHPDELANTRPTSHKQKAQGNCPQQWLDAAAFLPQDELRWTSMVYVCGVARFASDMLQYGGACAGEMVGAGELEPGPAGELMEAVRGGQRAEAWKMLVRMESGGPGLYEGRD